jgi:hypothetical protein
MRRHRKVHEAVGVQGSTHFAMSISRCAASISLREWA